MTTDAPAEFRSLPDPSKHVAWQVEGDAECADIAGQASPFSAGACCLHLFIWFSSSLTSCHFGATRHAWPITFQLWVLIQSLYTAIFLTYDMQDVHYASSVPSYPDQ